MGNLRPRSSTPRRGGVYIAVLGVAMIIALVGLASLHLSRVETDVLAGAEQVAHAEALAQSAVELGISRVLYDVDWRTNVTSGAEVPPSSWVALGTGSLKYVFVDGDGNLADDARDEVIVRGIGKAGEAIQVATVTLQPTNDPMSCLNVAFHAGGAVTSSGPTITCNQTVSSNNDITVSGGGSITGNAWAVGNISGSVGGSKDDNETPPRTMPDSTSVWNYYLANGTYIDIADLTGNKIEYAVLSAGNNPYGAENVQGIYIIDCENQPLKICKSRIHATLVILNPSGALYLDDSLCWDPPAANYPALMVQGNLQMEWDGGSPLSESLGVNFNPPSTPYANASDGDLSDSYPGVINGLVYVSGNLTANTVSMLDGVTVVGGTATFTANANLTYDATIAQYPPPGFAAGNVMRVIPRTWKRVAQ